MSENSLDEENKRKYAARAEEWGGKSRDCKDYSRDSEENKEGYAKNEQEIKITKKKVENAYTVNRSIVNSKTYHDKFEYISTHKSVNESLYRESKMILEHRDGTEYEDLVILDARTGKRIVSNMQRESSLKTGLTYDEYLKVKNFDGKIVMLHNHPGGGRLSGTDILTMYKEDKAELSMAVGHDGTIHIISNMNRNVDIEKIYNKWYDFYKQSYTREMAKIKATDRLYELNLFDYKEV